MDEHTYLQGVKIKAKESGVALFVVLIALVALSLAALGLIRSVDTSTLILGNLGFKQASTAVSDRTAEIAINWLNNNSSGQTLFNDYSSSSIVYYASAADNLDVTGNNTALSPRRAVDWGSGCSGTTVACLASAVVPAGSSGITKDYTSRFIIERMCRTAGDSNNPANSCAQPLAPGTSPNKRGELKYGEDKRFSGTSGPFYRIVVRTVGPRNTVSFTETYIHL
jgi:type IV pilus assembly protein PilX